MVLRKKKLALEYWPRLLKEAKKVHFVKTDFDKVRLCCFPTSGLVRYANIVCGSGSMRMSKMKLKKMTMQPILAVSARTAVSVVSTSPSSAVELALIWPVQKARARKRKKMYERSAFLLQIGQNFANSFL
jgi:hypothetical protein